ncbi:long-chain fatty-acid-CoA ligase [Myriangium duriaei CBS 260.36]|uniref:Long-chain fatty-acid-CoA ligase n=1 Tax=Myriangium duriaei CBS 260.36 TaxID=1168546 RepID=A0A9P4J756_9PEZI|nr:long-chain fatty-acid-CoA ligase [Myriangium duriaei CBS 260.36]
MALQQERHETVTPVQLSLFHGPSQPPLTNLTLGAFLDHQCELYGDRECAVIPWTNTRWTYDDIRTRSLTLARYLYSVGIRPGDRVAILAGNCAEYIAVFYACMRLGSILVILNNTYTASEASYALQYSESKVLFATPQIGRLDNSSMLSSFSKSGRLPALERTILINGRQDGLMEFDTIINSNWTGDVESIQASLSPYDVCNLQFTSGSTGNPKAAMLTHHGLLNNSRFIGDRMALTPDDVLCCPPPLFHCFGLVLGMLAVMTHGAKIVYPSDSFDPVAVLNAISDEKCTAVHGVPAMFDTIFSTPRPAKFDCSRLRTGIIAGAPVPRYLMELLVNEFGMTEFTSSYGLTEASPTCFNAFTFDTIERRLTTVGTLMPHAHGKIVDKSGAIVPIGVRGELCIAGYQLQRGYFRNPTKTAEAMITDAEGVVWLHTGDEAVFDKQGYCTITGRFKDIIIRGGENIYPLEIEERLMQHGAVERAIVVGLSHARYGEVVAAFLLRKEGMEKMGDEEVRAWCREKLGRQKAPQHVFWLGEGGVSADIPITGSGKVKKFEFKRVGEELLLRSGKAKL